MRFGPWSYIALGLFTFVLPVSLLGQFQPPTDEELKMTSEPKAPGAAAVYLYREETTDDTYHFHTYFVRIKVLTEKGKELATVRTPYERSSFTVTNIQGRTIHSDGTIVPLTAKPSDLTDVKTKGYQVNTMVFTLPDVQVGSVLEYRLTLRYSDEIVSSPTWQVQQPYYVRKAHYYFRPEQTGGRYITNSRGDLLNKLMYSNNIKSDAKVIADNKGTYSLDVTDIPPLPDEDWMPPLNTVRWKVEFYYTNFATGADFWQTNGKRWGKEAEHFTNPTGTLKNAVAGIVAAGDSEAVKSQKIYAAVMKLENTDFTRRKSQAERKAEKIKAIKEAEDVWKQQSGSGDDIALLYVALGRAAGLKVWPMQVVNRNTAFFDNRYLSLDQLDDYLVLAQIDGKEVYLDPGQKMCPYGILHWKHTYASGLVLSDKGTVAGTTPGGTYKSTVVQRVADLTIDETGSLSGSMRIVMSGQEALYWRHVALQNDEDEVKKQFNEYIQAYVPEGVQADFDHFLSLDDPNTNLLAMIKVSGNLGTVTGKHMFLPGLFFESRTKHPFVSLDKRVSAIDVHYPRTDMDDVTYRLPAGFTIESAPQSANNTWPDHAVLKITSTPKDGTVTVVRTLLYNYALLNDTEYPALHDFYQKVASADQQQLVLNRASAAKGN